MLKLVFLVGLNESCVQLFRRLISFANDNLNVISLGVCKVNMAQKSCSISLYLYTCWFLFKWKHYMVSTASHGLGYVQRLTSWRVALHSRVLFVHQDPLMTRSDMWRVSFKQPSGGSGDVVHERLHGMKRNYLLPACEPSNNLGFFPFYYNLYSMYWGLSRWVLYHRTASLEMPHRLKL